LREQRCLKPVNDESAPPRTLLLLDDEPSVLYALERLFRREGYNILLAHTPTQALELMACNEVQVVISDQRMGEMHGTEFMARARELHPNTVRMILSGYADMASIKDAVNRGAVYKYLSKPWDDEELRATVREAFQRAESADTRRIG
jgi:response regulator RpfG family c-di-GMP phosphodiesterase